MKLTVNSIEDKAVERVNSLLLPTATKGLLMPMTAVAEVVACRVSESRRDPNAPWFYGWITWREQQIPLLSWESATGGEAPDLPLTSGPVAVINAIGPAAHLGFIALRLESYPRPVHVAKEDLLDLSGAEIRETGVLMQAIVDGIPAVVPEMSLMEQCCAGLAPHSGA